MDPAHSWKEYSTPNSKVYWHNARTGESTWEKPEALRTPVEKALSSTNWKQYETAEGKKYYVHSATNETTWELPSDVQEAIDKAVAAAAAAPSPLPPTSAASPFVQATTSLTGQSGALVSAGSVVPITAGLQNATTTATGDKVLDFGSTEEAIKAFMAMLRKKGVTPAQSWQDVMRQVVTEPVYQALRNLADRRAAFERYIEEYKKREKETRERNLERIRPAWREGLGRATEGEGGMKSWWSWERSRRALSDGLPEMWRMARDDEERRILWEEYVGELRRKEEQRDRDLRQRNIEKVDALLKQLGLDLASTTWQSARREIERSSEWRNDSELRQIAPTDLLSAYEDLVRDLEQHANETRQRQKEERRRRARKAREGFVALLHELSLAKHLKAGMQWPDVRPLVEKDERYLALLGHNGSSPLELFWDIIDPLDEAVEADRARIGPILTQQSFAVQADTSLESFLGAVSTLTDLSDERKEAVLRTLQQEAARNAKEERRKQERRLRGQIDDLRHALRKLEPALDADVSWEDAVPLISGLDEYKSLPDDASRRTAFDKHIRRLKERTRERDVSDAESTRSDRRSQRQDSAKPRNAREDEDERRSSRAPPSRARSRDRDNRDRERDRDRDRSSDKRSLQSSSSKRDRERDEEADDRRRPRERREERRESKRSRPGGDEQPKEEGEI